MKDFLNTQELALRWGMTPDHLRRWRSDGQGPPYIKLPGDRTIRYRMEDVIRFEDKHLVTPKGKADAK